MNDILVIQSKIYEIRGQRVMLDRDLADMYGVETRRLNEQVKRNIERFPEDFMFQLTKGELELLRSQLATSNRAWCCHVEQCVTLAARHPGEYYHHAGIRHAPSPRQHTRHV